MLKSWAFGQHLLGSVMSHTPGLQALHWGMIHPSASCFDTSFRSSILSTKTSALPNALQTLQSNLLCSRSPPFCPVHETKSSERRKVQTKSIAFQIWFDELNNLKISLSMFMSIQSLEIAVPHATLQCSQFRALAPWSPVSVFSVFSLCQFAKAAKLSFVG